MMRAFGAGFVLRTNLVRSLIEGLWSPTLDAVKLRKEWGTHFGGWGEENKNMGHPAKFLEF